jgi:hypothetical protein
MAEAHDAVEISLQSPHKKTQHLDLKLHTQPWEKPPSSSPPPFHFLQEREEELPEGLPAPRA